MLTAFEHKSGLIFSIKTFRPLWVFSWHSSIWRQFPFRTCIATIRYNNKMSARAGHKELTLLLQDLEIGPRMAEPFQAIESFGKAKTNSGVKSYRIYPGHVAEGKLIVKVTPKRND
jgi:hypothetical protein